ncbi:MAG: nucleotidyltransferase domain-containing protein [Candidatus Verstraetearchaeota archaeon]|nr:nucleotidyltransferase domain-containing protein [Candidatus Verstraetearchaeota archaeon]
MPNLSPEDTRRHERIIEAVKHYTQQNIVPKLKPLLVILYGSTAKGEHTPASDIDLLIVADNLPKNYWDRWSLAYSLVENRPLDPHIYTPQEFKEMIKQGRMTALDALTEGITLHADPKYQQEINKLLKQTLKKRVKIKNMWIPKEILPKLQHPKPHRPY